MYDVFTDMKFNKKDNPLRNYHQMAYLLFGALFFITLYLFFIIKQKKDVYNQQVFENRIQLAKVEIEGGMKNYIVILESTRALFVSTDTVTRNEWQSFISALDLPNSYPGSHGLRHAVFVKPDDLKYFVQRIKKEKYKDFKVFPEGERSVYCPIIFSDPTTKANEKFIGFDIFSDSIRREALLKAIDKNEAIISGKIKLMSDTSGKENTGFIIYLPYYNKLSNAATVAERRDKIIGLISCSFSSQEILGKILQDQFPDLDIEVYDKEIKKESLLFDKDTRVNYFNNKGKYSKVVPFQFADRTWSIFFAILPEFESFQEEYFPYTILAGGLIINILILVLSLTFLKNRSKNEEIKVILIKQNKKLIIINNDLDTFVYTASHDLRVPVANLEGLMGLIKEEIKETEANKNLNDLIKMTKESIMKLENTIADLSNISRLNKELEEGFDTIEMQSIIKEILFLYKKSIEETKVKITMDLQEPTLKFPKKNLRSIIENLLSNAIKYRSPERTPEILIQTKKQDGGVLLIFKDNGLGIPSGYKYKIFEMFKRAHDHVPGTGIGLYIVKRIMENSGGSIVVKSEEGKGSTFICYFNILPEAKKINSARLYKLSSPFRLLWSKL